MTPGNRIDDATLAMLLAEISGRASNAYAGGRAMRALRSAADSLAETTGRGGDVAEHLAAGATRWGPAITAAMERLSSRGDAGLVNWTVRLIQTVDADRRAAGKSSSPWCSG